MTYLGPVIPNKIVYPNNKCYSILAFDPGGTTGWSMLAFPKVIGGIDALDTSVETVLESKVCWFHGHIDCNPIDEGAKEIRELCDQWSRAVIIFEDFWIKQIAVDLAPVELIAIARHHLWMKGRILHKQQAAMAKRLDNARLKHLGVYTSIGGLDHARDADRHVLMTVRRCMEKPNGKKFRKKLWPNEN